MKSEEKQQVTAALAAAIEYIERFTSSALARCVVRELRTAQGHANHIRTDDVAEPEEFGR